MTERSERPSGGAVHAYVPDLMDRSKIAAVAPGTRFAARLADLAPEQGDTVVVDLGRPGAVAALPALVATGARVVGFGSHVDAATLDAARAAGATEVLARSAFFLPGRLRELLTPT